MTPTDFEKVDKIKGAMITPELDRVIAREKEKGSAKLDILLIERYKRTATPFATIILTFIGFSIASRKTRGGMGLHLLIGLGISSLYVLMMQFSTTFALKADLSPLLAVWLPNMVFSIVALVTLWFAQK